MILEGATSVKAALEAQKRKVYELIIKKGKNNRNLRYIYQKAKEINVPIVYKSEDEINDLAKGKTHGGILARVGERKKEFIDDLNLSPNAFILLVEGIVDPYNFGYIVRSAFSAGCEAILMPTYHWHDLEATIVKSSAGAFEHCQLVQSDNLVNDVLKFKKQGFHILAGYRKQAIAYDEVNYQGPIVLCIGGELRGLSKNILKEVETAIYIPYANNFRNALNGASAAAVFCFEVLRQRRQK